MNYSKSSLLVYVIGLVLICTNEIHCAGSPRAVCQEVGTKVCSADCTQILFCTSIGHEPLPYETCQVNNDGRQTYCNEGSGATPTVDCSALSPDCSAAEGLPVECIEFGEFPNPSKCGSTIKCSETEVNGNPSYELKTCSCPANKFPNLDKPNLVCDQTTCSYTPVVCQNPGQTGPIGNSSSFCYTCAVEKVYVHYCTNVKKSSTPNHFKRAGDGKACQ